MAVLTSTTALCNVGEQISSPVDKAPVPDRKMVLHIVGPDGQPVAGAKMGTGLNVFENSQGHPPQTIVMWLRGQKRWWPFSSDASGDIPLAGQDAAYRNFYVSYPAQGWVGYRQLLEGGASGRVEVRLEPACHVHGQLTSSGFDSLGHPLSRTIAFLYDSRGHLLMYFVSERGRYEFLLPSGRYELECLGEGPGGIETQRRRVSLDIEPGQRVLDLGSTDLPSTRLAELFGKPAPALEKITEWRGQRPARLAFLHGSVVALVFWGSWSRPCLQTMPKLIELYDAYYDKGLVIISVHDNSVADVQELETKLVEARKLYWGSRALPFPVGLDVGEKRGAAHEAYGVDQWPTAVVIDREGNVAGKFSPWGALQKELSRLLGDG